MITCNDSKPASYNLRADLWLPADPEDVFKFFSDAHNLDSITPPWLGFRILTPRPIEMHVGALIDYRLRLHAIPIRWQTEITAWEPPLRFVDSQRRGPYQFWRHEHTFNASNGGTIVCDNVDYSVWGGRLVHRLFVKKDLQSIFEYRRQKLSDRFDVKANQ